MRLESWAATDQGRTRKNNEDHYYLAPDLGLMAVADGMGGFDRGEVASELACSVLRETISAQRDTLSAFGAHPSPEKRLAVLDLMQAAIQKACLQVHSAASALSASGRMGTTLDVVLIIKETAFIAHVGDGRIYLCRKGEVHQLTDDHSLIAEQLREGAITPDQARRARNRSVITRALGAFPSVLVDTLDFQLDAGDSLIICSDGLHRYIGPRELGFTLEESKGQTAATALIELANSRGGRDNITVVICNTLPDASTEEPSLVNARQMDTLRKVDLLASCTYKELMAIRLITAVRKLPAGHTLFSDGDQGRECFFIEQGEVRIEKDGHLLSVLGPGSAFGEMSFLDFPRRSATAIIASDASLLTMHRDRFIQLLKQDPELGVKLSWQLLKKLSRIVRRTNEQLVSESVPLTDERPRS
jgi:serine/threonine protein phosphatase PrpC